MVYKDLEKKKAYLERTKEHSKLVNKDYNYRRKFGISLSDYNKMLSKQDECCYICCRHYSEFTRALAVDHCHETGRVRGLLCPGCNGFIGRFENKTFMQDVANYLDENRVPDVPELVDGHWIN